jgi:hypothetical protein
VGIDHDHAVVGEQVVPLLEAALVAPDEEQRLIRGGPPKLRRRDTGGDGLL